MKGKVLVFSAAGILLAGGITALLWAGSGKVDPEAVKAELKAELEKVNALPLDRVIEKDELVHALLLNEVYVRHGGEVRRGIERSHERLHEEAERERSARARVKPFLAKIASLRSSPERLRREAAKLGDEGRALHDRFGATAYGPRLEESLRELESLLAGAAAESGSWEVAYAELQGRAERLASGGDLAAALAEVEAFAAARTAAGSSELGRKLDELRASLGRKAAAPGGRDRKPR